MPVAVLLLLLLFGECWARLVNVTIDDTYGDARTGAIPSYAPAAQWGPVTSSSGDVQNGTLRCPDGNGNLTLTFEGTLIYVFFVFPDEDRDTPINVASYLNGESKPSGRYSRQSNVSDGGPPEYLYNVLVFQSTPLPQRKHTLTVTIEAWLSYFDYALYTVDDGTVDSPQESGPASVVPPHSAGVPVSQSPSGSGSLTISTAQTETAPSEPGTLPSATLLPLSSATETLGKDTSTGNPSRSPHARRNRPALIAGPVAAAVVLIGLLVCFCVWRRRRSVVVAQRASSADATISRFVPPPAARDTSESMVPTSDKTTRPRASTKASTLTHDDADGSSVTPFIAQPDPAPAESEKQSRRAAIVAKQNIPSALRVGTGGPSTPGTHAPVDIGAELERMLAQNARAREEIELLRQAVEPPPYSHSQRGTGVERLGNA